MPPPHQEGVNAPQTQAVREQHCHSAHLNRALVEVLPVIFFGEKGTQQVMALRDSGCHATLIDESVARTLGLEGREIDLEIQSVNAQKAFTSQHIKRCHVARVGKDKVKYLLRDVKTIPNFNGPDQKLKWSSMKHEYCHLKDLDLQDTDTGPVQLIIGTNNSDLVLPKQIVKPSSRLGVD